MVLSVENQQKNDEKRKNDFSINSALNLYIDYDPVGISASPIVVDLLKPGTPHTTNDFNFKSSVAAEHS